MDDALHELEAQGSWLLNKSAEVISSYGESVLHSVAATEQIVQMNGLSSTVWLGICLGSAFFLLAFLPILFCLLLKHSFTRLLDCVCMVLTCGYSCERCFTLRKGSETEQRRKRLKIAKDYGDEEDSEDL
jgi:hypothetical protein